MNWHLGPYSKAILGLICIGSALALWGFVVDPAIQQSRMRAYR